jgi:WD40 repeat protein
VPDIDVQDGVEVWYVPDAERTYLLVSTDPDDPHLPGVLKTFDSSAGIDGGVRDIGPDIPVEGYVFSVSSTAGGRRVVVTTLPAVAEPSEPFGGPAVTTVIDGRTGRALGEPIVGPGLTQVSVDGTLLGATAGTITEYDLETHRPIAVYPGEGGQVSRIQFSRDGRLALVSSNAQSVSIYDVATRSRLGDPIPTYSPIDWQGTLRPDGKALAVTVAGGVEIWDLGPDRLAEATCGIVGRNLTRAEWATYMADFGEYRRTCPDLP